MVGNFSVKITVFTPVYNRGYCIRNVYDSLCKQTFHNFEWLVINDGSSDNTDEVIKECMAEKKIMIRYFTQKNGGQHRALNRAIQNSNGMLLMIVDSDDKLTPDALEKISDYEDTIHGMPGFAGVSGLRFYPDGRTIGGEWPYKNKSYIDLTNIQRYKYNLLLGDKAEAYYVDILKRYAPIPEFPGENDVEKGVLWNRIAAVGLKVRWFKDPIYQCEYLSDGMSKNIEKNYQKNFLGYSCYVKEFVHYDIGTARKIKTAIVYCELARKKGVHQKEVHNLIDIPLLLVQVAYIASYLSPIRKIKKRLWRTF